MIIKRKNWLYDIFCDHIFQTIINSYHKIDYSGIENIPTKGPALMLPKHQSYKDIELEGLMLKKAGRYGLWYMRSIPIPFLEYIGGFGNTIRAKDIRKISREKREDITRKARLVQGYINSYQEQLYSIGEIVVMHPEGTRNPGKMGDVPHYIFKAAKTAKKKYRIDVPIIPVGIEYENIWKKGSKVWIRAGSQINIDTPDIEETVKKEIKRLSNLA